MRVQHTTQSVTCAIAHPQSNRSSEWPKQTNHMCVQKKTGECGWNYYGYKLLDLVNHNYYRFDHILPLISLGSTRKIGQTHVFSSVCLLAWSVCLRIVCVLLTTRSSRTEATFTLSELYPSNGEWRREVATAVQRRWFVYYCRRAIYLQCAR